MKLTVKFHSFTKQITCHHIVCLPPYVIYCMLISRCCIMSLHFTVFFFLLIFNSFIHHRQVACEKKITGSPSMAMIWRCLIHKACCVGWTFHFLFFSSGVQSDGLLYILLITKNVMIADLICSCHLSF